MYAPVSVTRDARAQIIRALPEALQPSWLESTWAGVHGSGGLRAEVRSTGVEATLANGALTGESFAKGAVLDGSDKVGTFTRDVELHEGGRLEVHHSYLRLDDSAQGSGFARGFNDRAFDRYAKAGVDDVTIDAALDVGGYAWARQGFELDSGGAVAGERELARAMEIRNLVAEAEFDGRLFEEDVALLDPRLLGADGIIHSRTLTSIQDLAAIPEVGRRVLLGSAWEGVREIPRQQPWWDSSASGARDVRDGVSHLTDPGTTAKRGAAAASRLEATLPPPARATDVRDAFARHFANSANVGQAAGTTLELSGDALKLASRTKVDLGDAKVTADVSLGKKGGLHVRQSIHGDADGVRPALEDVWRDLGVTSVADPSGKPRSL